MGTRKQTSMNNASVERRARRVWAYFQREPLTTTQKLILVGAALSEATTDPPTETASQLLRWRDLEQRCDVTEATLRRALRDLEARKSIEWEDLPKHGGFRITLLF